MKSFSKIYGMRETVSFLHCKSPPRNTKKQFYDRLLWFISKGGCSYYYHRNDSCFISIFPDILKFTFLVFMFGFKLLLQMFSILTEASTSSSGNKTQDWRPNMMNGGVPVSIQGLSCSFDISTDATTGLHSTYWIFLPNVILLCSHGF